MINEDGVFKHHKKKKKRDAAELCTEESSNYHEINLKHHKKKKKKAKPELLAESHVDSDEEELQQLKKKKKKTEISDLTRSKHHKKKKRDTAELLIEESSNYNEVKLTHHKMKKKKEKHELLDVNSYKEELEQLKKKKKKEKTKISDLSQESQSEKRTDQNPPHSETCTLYSEAKINFDGHKHKHGKKHKKDKKSNLNKKETFAIVEETEVSSQKHKKGKIHSHVSEAVISNEDEVSAESRKKHKKCKENSDIPKTFNRPGVMAEKQKKRKHQVSHIDANDCYDLEINSSNHHRNKRKGKNMYDSEVSAVVDELKTFFNVATEADNDRCEFKTNSSDHHRQKNRENNLNVAEATTVNDKTETFPKKPKKKKKHLDNIEAYTIFNQHDLISDLKISLNEDNVKCAEINTISDKPDMLKKYQKIQKSNEDGLHASNFNVETGELNDKLHADSRNKSSKKRLMTDCDESAIKHKKHKKKHKNILNYDSNNDGTSLELNTQCADVVDSAFNDGDINLSSKHWKKSKSKKKHKNILNYDSNIDGTSLELNTQSAAVADSAFNDGDINLSSKHRKKSKSKKKDKKNRENNLNTADVNENLNNLKQNFTDNTRNFTEIDISDILLNKEISHSPVNLYAIENESNCVTNGTTVETIHSLSNSVHKHKRKNKHKHLKNSTLNTREFNNESDFDHRLNNKAADVTDYTNGHLQSITNKDTRHSAKLKKIAPNERIETAYFSSDIDCSEDPVDFDVPPLHQFETVHRLTENQKSNFLESGVFIKTGKFTAAEDKIIQKNFEDFVKRFGVSDAFSLLGIGKYGKDTELLNFVKAKHFYVRLAKDLNDRSLFSVYKRARKILHPFRNSGKLTEKEVAHLKRLHVALPKKWQQIGDTLGNTADRCAETYRWHEKDIAKGKFTEEEETELIEALKTVSGNSDISCRSLKGINWEAVASHVPSRNSSQCRMYWANNLAWAPGSAKKKWNWQCCAKLVHILKELNVECSSKIDWYKVYESFENFAPSDLYVHKHWLYLRSRIPDYKNKTFKKIVEHLCNKYPLSQEE